MNTIASITPYNLNKTESTLSLCDNEEVDNLDETTGNREIFHFHFFNGRATKFMKTTSGKIILGVVIIAGVGILGAIIAVSVTLSRRNITNSNKTTRLRFSSTIPQATLLPQLRIQTSVFYNTSTQSITPTITQTTKQPSMQLTPSSNIQPRIPTITQTTKQSTTQLTTSSSRQSITPTITQTTKQPSTQLTANYTIQSITSTITQPTTQSSTQLTTSSSRQSITPTITQTTKQPSTQLTANYTIQSITPTITHTTKQSSTQLTANYTIQSITSTITQTTKQPSTQLTANYTIQSITSTITQPTTQSTTQLTTSSSRQSITPTITHTTKQSSTQLTANYTIQSITPTITQTTKQSTTQLTANYTIQSITSTITQITKQSSMQLTPSSIVQSIPPTITLSTREPIRKKCQQSLYPPKFILRTANNLASQVNTQNMQQQLHKLLAFGPRDNTYNSKSDAYYQAIVNISSTLNNMGLRTYRQDFLYGEPYFDDLRNSNDQPLAQSLEIEVAPESERCRPTKNSSCNLCTLIPGKTNKIIIIGAHLDTVEGSLGANDNGSGVVALLEAIRIFKNSNLKLNNSILFCFWGSKELPPKNKYGVGFGSKFFLYDHTNFIKKLVKDYNCLETMDNSKLMCYLNIESAGTKNRKNKVDISIEDPSLIDEATRINFGLDPGPGTHNLTEIYAEFLTSRKINFVRVPTTKNKSDETPFYDYILPIPAVTIKATADSIPSCYHKPCDDFANVNFSVLSDITQTVVYALAKLSLSNITHIW